MAQTSTAVSKHTSRRAEVAIVAVALVSLALFALLLVAVWHLRSPIGIDDDLAGAASSPSAHTLTRATWLGSPLFVFAAVVAVALVAYARRDNIGIAICIVGPVLAGLCVLVAKPTVDRVYGSALSYPSGHATLAAALAAVIVLMSYRLGGAKAAAIAAVVVAAIPLVASVAVVRLAWHLPSDAIGGVALGVGVVCGTAVVVGRIPRNRTN